MKRSEWVFMQPSVIGIRIISAYEKCPDIERTQHSTRSCLFIKTERR